MQIKKIYLETKRKPTTEFHSDDVSFNEYVDGEGNTRKNGDGRYEAKVIQRWRRR